MTPKTAPDPAGGWFPQRSTEHDQMSNDASTPLGGRTQSTSSISAYGQEHPV